MITETWQTPLANPTLVTQMMTQTQVTLPVPLLMITILMATGSLKLSDSSQKVLEITKGILHLSLKKSRLETLTLSMALTLRNFVTS